jgi:hypothetical protein
MEFQQAIYTLEEGGGAVWLRRLLLGFGFLILAAWFDISKFHGFDNPEAMDSAQIARQIDQGQGFTTLFVRPLALAQLRDLAYRRQGGDLGSEAPASAAPHSFAGMPDTFNPPLFPGVEAALFKVTGVDLTIPPQSISKLRRFAPEMVVLLFNQACLALTAALLLIVGRLLFDRRVAWLGAAAYLVTGLSWQFSISGTALPLAGLFVVAAVLALQRGLAAEDQEEGGRGWVWVWLLLGAAFLASASLTVYGAVWLFLPYLAIAASAFRARWGLTVAALLLGAVLLAPWAARNVCLTGNVLGSNAALVGATGASYPGTTLERSFRLKPDVLLWKDGLHKAFGGLQYHAQDGFRLLGSGVAAAFFVASLMHPFRRRATRVVRIFLLGGLVALAIGASLATGNPEPGRAGNLLFLLWPPVALFGAAFFFILLDRLELSLPTLRYGVIGLFLAVSATPLGLTLLRGGGGVFAYPPYFPPILAFSAQWFQPDEALASDIPWAVAWYQDRASLWLPVTIKEYLEINDFVQPLHGLLLTPLSRNAGALLDVQKGEWKEWASLLLGQGVPSGFPLTAATPLPPDNNDYLLLSDRARWRPSEAASP